MVKVMEMKLNSTTKEAEVSLFADAKADVTPNMKVQGLPNGYSIAFGSSVLTASAELGFMKSNGEWNWS